jgi:oligoendopeptidase F
MRQCCRPLILTALAVAVLFFPPARAEERANIPDKYKWNLADLYPSDDAWSRAKDDVAARIPKMAEFQGRLGESAEAFYSAVSAMFDLERDLARLQDYASFRKDEDTRVGRSREMDQVAAQIGVQFGVARSFVRPEILSLGVEKVNGFVAADRRLVPYKPWLDDILRYAPHTLSAAEERVAAQSGMMAQGPMRIYNVFTNADLPYPEVTLANGDKVRLDAQGYFQYRAATNRDDRDLVFKAFWSRYKEYERTVGAALDAQVQGHLYDRNVHRFGSCLEEAIFDSNIPVSVYQQLIADVRANLPTLHRYLRLRQRMMGVDQLRYEDLYAPIVKDVDLHYTPEQAEDLVLKAVAPLGPDYVATLQKGFASGWVDFMPSTGKTAGAYSEGIYGVHPYQLLNFTGLYEDVSTLAHESGHSLHSYLSNRAQPYVTHDYKTFVAEVASTLNENLLLHYLLDQTTDPDTRLSLLGIYLDGLRTTLFRQVLFAEFELKVHELAEKGDPLTGEKVSQLYLGLLREYYADGQGVCKVDDLYGVEWASVLHFWNYNFYIYQYATSITASQQIATDMRADAAAPKPTTKTRDAYLAMLAMGSSRYPIDELKSAGVDMTTSGPFNAAMKEMNGIMDEMERLLAAPQRGTDTKK